jgi:cbb3-type cytochrome oxidase subunit 3
MIKDVLTYAANSIWPQISLIIFVVCFIGILIWALTGKKERFRHESQLPLHDGTADNTPSTPSQS